MSEAGFEIHGRFFPMPAKLKARDTLLIRELTGMSFREWAEASDTAVAVADSDLDVSGADPELVLGWVGVAVWNANPSWARSDVVGYVGDLALDEIKGVGGEQSPPAETRDAEASPTSLTPLNGSQASPTPQESPTTSGVPG